MGEEGGREEEVGGKGEEGVGLCVQQKQLIHKILTIKIRFKQLGVIFYRNICIHSHVLFFNSYKVFQQQNSLIFFYFSS